MRIKLVLAVILVIFAVHCLSLGFTQDDAFISYRYVENFIHGNGLVFNSGERVEGYTNFLWIVLLSLFAKLGLDMITVSKILGIVSGGVCLILLHRISQLFLPKEEWLLSLFPPLLLSASSAFAYWSISGLETSFFVTMVLLSAYLYLTRPGTWWIACALSALVRPEGVMIFGILFLHELAFRKGQFKKTLQHLGGFVLLLLPFAVFKVYYYGDLLPNPFYAKTGLSFEYVKSGLEYFWQFLKHYGLWGIAYVLPLLFYRSLQSGGRLLLLLAYVYTLYIVVVGGDVLKAHRFFLPILPFLYLLLVISVRELFFRFKREVKHGAIPVILLLSVAFLLFFLPYSWTGDVRTAEIALVEGMKFRAEYLKASFPGRFSAAVSTIGSISYHLGTRIKVIDMLGLTDRNISKHPETLEGIAPTWKERKYNTRYLLSRDPDFILFSTGVKPSAPAERALFLNSKFRKNYSPVYVPFGQGRFIPIFRRKGVFPEENQVFTDTRFIDLFAQALHLRQAGEVLEAIETLEQVVSIGPQDFALPYELMGQYHYESKDFSAAEEAMRKAIELDERSVMAHFHLARIYIREGRQEDAERETEKVLRYNPNFQW
ncbi:MAG: tetratricopeptide repeat protein [Candidatus Zixiibacteriota bacterium]|nr:MAG: tetratricopeptide repeat protein [candidate division Zixibacteria bacterium]